MQTRLNGRRVGLYGYAALYNIRSGPIDGRGGTFREVCNYGCFDRALRAGADVRVLLEHKPAIILARSSRPGPHMGTLRIWSDAKGLAFEIPELPSTYSGRSIAESVDRGDLDGMSVGFSHVPGGDKWRMDPDGPVRELISVDLLEISITAFPAYPFTQVKTRSTWQARGQSLHKALLEMLTKMAST